MTDGLYQLHYLQIVQWFYDFLSHRYDFKHSLYQKGTEMLTLCKQLSINIKISFDHLKFFIITESEVNECLRLTGINPNQYVLNS